MKKTSSILLILALIAIVVMGCSADEVKEQISKERRAMEAAKRSMEVKPYKSTPVGDPFSTVKDNPRTPPDKDE